MEIYAQSIAPTSPSQTGLSELQQQPQEALQAEGAQGQPRHVRPADIIVLLYPSRYGSLSRAGRA